ncbi:MAG: NDP-sugar synthase [Bradymonadales bacterium]|nr:NDP-sugar synthase [Bradymonadales bacterium]
MARTDEVTGIVLAAGHGQRLRPLTDFIPKPVLPFLNRPLLTYSLEVLWRAGVRRIGLNTFHLGRQVRQAVETWAANRSDPSPSITVTEEAQLMGTGGGARQVWSRLGEPQGTCVVLNGDMVADFDLSALLQKHRETGWAASLAVARGGEGRIFMDSHSSRILGLPDRSGTFRLAGQAVEFSFCGVSLLETSAMAVLPRQPGCLLRDGLAGLLRQGCPIAALPSEGVHRDVGTPSRYLEATSEMLRRQATEIETEGVDLPPGTELLAPVLLAGEVRLMGAARLGPVCVAGGQTRFASGTLADHSIAYDARLEGDCRYQLQVGQVVLPLL